MTDKILIDECLSATLVAVAKQRGLVADYGPHIGKRGWQDWNLVTFALENDYVIVTNTRRDFLEEYFKLELHDGFLILVPSVERAAQVRLFDIALDAELGLRDDLVNKIIEVLLDGSAHVRAWTSDQHDICHIDDPKWSK